MFENLFTSLMQTGGSLQSAPTSMSQVTIPQMPLEPGSIGAAVGANVSDKFPEMVAAESTKSAIPEGILQALAVGGVSALGGGQEEKQQVQAPMFRGSALFDNPGAEAFSGRRIK